MAKYVNTIQYDIKTNLDASGIAKLQKELLDVERKLAGMSGGSLYNDGSLNRDMANIKKFRQMMLQSYDASIGMYNGKDVSESIKKVYGSVGDMHQSMMKAGSAGSQAFTTLTTQISSLNTGLQTTSTFFQKMGTTFGNTLRWGVAAGALQEVTSSIGKAVSYVKELDESLTQITMVSGESRDNMKEFASYANKAAAGLGSATTDYTNAVKVFIQEGFNLQESKAQATQATILGNVSEQDTATTADQITAYRNAFGVSINGMNSSLDKIASLANNTAANVGELMTASQRAASTASAVGASQDNFLSSIATIQSVTRESAENIGNGLKSIYTRFADVQVDNKTEDGIDVGKYGQALASVGVNIIDGNGQYKGMDQIFSELQNVWDKLDEGRKVAVGETVAGRYQYNRFATLMNNKDYFDKAYQSTQNAGGSMNKMQDAYMEGINAQMQKLETNIENIFTQIYNSGVVEDVVKMVVALSDGFTTLFDCFKDGTPILTSLVAIVGKLFSQQLAKSYTNATEKAYQQVQIRENREAMRKLGRQRIDTTNMSTEEGKREAEFWNTTMVGSTSNEFLTKEQLQGRQELINNRGENLSRLYKLEFDKSLYGASGGTQGGLDKYLKDKQNSYVNLRKATQWGMSNLDDKGTLTQSLARVGGNGIMNGLNPELAKQAREAAIELTTLKEGQKGYTEALQKAQQVMRAAAQTAENLERAYQGEVAPLSELEDQLIQCTAAEAAYKKQQLTQNYMYARQAGLQTMIDLMGGVASGVTGAMMAFSSLNRTIQVFSNEDATLEEKIETLGSTLMGLTMTAPMVATALQTMFNTFKRGGALVTSAAAIEEAVDDINKQEDTVVKGTKVGENSANIVSKNAETAAIDKQNLSLKENSAQQAVNASLKAKGAAGSAAHAAAEDSDTGSTNANTAAEDLNKKSRLMSLLTVISSIAGLEADEIEKIKDTAATESLTAANLALIASSPLAAIVALTAAAAALAGGIYLIAKAIEYDRTVAKRTYEEEASRLENLREISKGVEENYKNLTESLDSWKSGKESLEGMVVGTTEWKDKIVELNDQMLTLIDTYKDLLQYTSVDGKTGLITISEEGIEEYTQSQLREKISVQNATAMQSLTTQLAKQKADLSDFKNKENFWEWGWKDGTTERFYKQMLGEEEFSYTKTKDSPVVEPKVLGTKTDSLGNTIEIKSGSSEPIEVAVTEKLGIADLTEALSEATAKNESTNNELIKQMKEAGYSWSESAKLLSLAIEDLKTQYGETMLTTTSGDVLTLDNRYLQTIMEERLSDLYQNSFSELPKTGTAEDSSQNSGDFVNYYTKDYAGREMTEELKQDVINWFSSLGLTDKETGKSLSTKDIENAFDKGDFEKLGVENASEALSAYSNAQVSAYLTDIVDKAYNSADKFFAEKTGTEGFADANYTAYKRFLKQTKSGKVINGELDEENLRKELLEEYGYTEDDGKLYGENKEELELEAQIDFESTYTQVAEEINQMSIANPVNISAMLNIDDEIYSNLLKSIGVKYQSGFETRIGMSSGFSGDQDGDDKTYKSLMEEAKKKKEEGDKAAAKSLREQAEAERKEDEASVGQASARNFALAQQGINILKETIDDYWDVISNGLDDDNEILEESKAMGGLQQAMEDLTGISGGLFDKEFLEKHSSEMKAAVEGDVKALDKLREAAGKIGLKDSFEKLNEQLNMGLDADGITKQVDKVVAQFKKLKKAVKNSTGKSDTKIKKMVGNLENLFKNDSKDKLTPEGANALQQYAAANGLNLHYDYSFERKAVVSDEEENLNEEGNFEQHYESYAEYLAGKEADYQSLLVEYQNQQIEKAIKDGTNNLIKAMNSLNFKFDSETGTFTVQNEIEGLTDVDDEVIEMPKYKNYSNDASFTGSASTTPNPTPETDDDKDESSDKEEEFDFEWYKQYEWTLRRLEKILSRLNDLSDRLWGKGRIKTLKDINKQLLYQARTFNVKYNDKQDFLDSHKKKGVDEYGDKTLASYGIKFNKYGEIIEKTYKKAMLRLKAAGDKEGFDDLKKRREKWSSVWDEMQEAIDSMISSYNQIQDNNLKMVEHIEDMNTAFSELVTTLNSLTKMTNNAGTFLADGLTQSKTELENAMIDLREATTKQTQYDITSKNKVNRTKTQSAQADLEYWTTVAKRYNDAGGQKIDLELEALINSQKTDKKTIARIKELEELKDAILKEMNIQETDIESKLTEASKNLEQVLSDEWSKIEAAQSAIQSVIEGITSKIQSVDESYSSILTSLNNGLSIVKTYFGDKSYAIQNTLLNEQLDVMKSQYDLYKTAYENILPEINDTIEKNEGNQLELAKETQKTTQEYQDKMSESMNNMIELMQQIFSNNINIDYNNFLKEAFGIDLTEYGNSELSWDSEMNSLKKTLNSNIYDDVEKGYQIQNLAYEYADLMNTYSNANAEIQKEITESMNEQIGYLEDKNELSKYDVEYAEKQLSVLKARIALEEAQKNKNNLQLRRDAMGNYSYIYTADSDKIAKAQQDLLKAQNDAYELSKQTLQDAQENAYKALSEVQSKILSISNDANLTTAEKTERIAAVWEEYHTYLNRISTDANSAFSNIADDISYLSEEIQKDFQNSGFGNLLTNMNSGEFVNSLGNEFGMTFYEAISDSSKWAAAGETLAEKIKNSLDEYDQTIIDQFGSIDEYRKQVLGNAGNRLSDAQESANSLITEANKTMTILDEDMKYLIKSIENFKLELKVSEGKEEMVKVYLGKLASAKSGAYTGEWGSEGKLMAVHEKELILNKSDTANILSAVDLVRQMKISGSSFSDIGFNNLSQNSAGDTIEQRVEITATFPNAEDASAIKQALLSLADTAYQEAHKNF